MATIADELSNMNKAMAALAASVAGVQQAVISIPAHDDTPVLNAIAAIDAKIGTVADSTQTNNPTA